MIYLFSYLTGIFYYLKGIFFGVLSKMFDSTEYVCVGSDFKRVIPLTEVSENYGPDYAELAHIFNHAVIEDNQGVWRWHTNSFMDRILGEEGGVVFHVPPKWAGHMNSSYHTGGLDLNELCVLAQTGEIPLEEYMKYYMQIGYSLSGFGDVFESKEVSDYGVEPIPTPQPDDFDPEEQYYQTPVEYMVLKYAGQILQL